MKESFLAEPGKAYEESFRQYAADYEGDGFYWQFYKKGITDFDGYLEDLRNHSKGIGLPEDMVTTSTYWLVCENNVVGVVRIRHEESGTAGHIGYDISPLHRNRGYGKLILKLALEKAAELGIEEAILTCNIENEASKKIIEGNGGEYMDEIYDEEEDERLSRYKVRTHLKT